MIKAEAPKLIPRKRIRATRPQFPLIKEEPQERSKIIKRSSSVTIKAKNRVDPDFLAAEFKDEVKEEPLEDEISPIEQAAEPLPGPPNWQLFVEKVRVMRQMREAPVDSMGCERTGDEGDPATPKLHRFQHLVALMLSAQTRDEVTFAAVERLREQLNPCLSPQAILDTPELTLAQIIYPVGFYRRKAQYLQKTSQILLDQYDGDIPKTIGDITKLPGVGPKMGYLLLQSAWNQVDGIGVDVHVHRLAQLWNWIPAFKSPTPEKTRHELEKWLPRELWAEINPLLVGFGQTWCPPRSSAKSCAKCHLFDLCPSAKVAEKK